MIIIGPLHTYWGIRLLVLEDSFISILELGIGVNIKHALNQRLGLYPSYFEKIMNQPLSELFSSYKVRKYLIQDIKNIEIQENKFFAHKLKLVTKDDEHNFMIENRNKIEEYQELLKDWKMKSHIRFDI